MNVLMLAFILQIFGLYAMILFLDYSSGARKKLKKSPVRIRR